MSNIKFTNNVLLDQSSVDGISGVDTSNKLVTLGGDDSWTATEDCIVTASLGGQWGGGATPTIDNIQVGGQGWPNSGSGQSASFTIPLKKGQLFKPGGGGYTSVWIFGLKK